MVDLENPLNVTHFSIGNENALANKPGGTLPPASTLLAVRARSAAFHERIPHVSSLLLVRQDTREEQEAVGQMLEEKQKKIEEISINLHTLRRERGSRVYVKYSSLIKYSSL